MARLSPQQLASCALDVPCWGLDVSYPPGYTLQRRKLGRWHDLSRLATQRLLAAGPLQVWVLLPSWLLQHAWVWVSCWWARPRQALAPLPWISSSASSR